MKAARTETEFTGHHLSTMFLSLWLSSQLCQLPLGAYFVLHGRDWPERILGVGGVISALIAIFCSGSRGGYVSVLVAMPVMTFFG